MAKPPKIVIPGLNRGAGIPGGYILGRSPRSKQGPAQLLNLIEVVRMGIQTVAGSSQGDADTGSTAASATSSLSSSISTQISSAVSTNVTQSTSLSQISSSLSGAISTNVGQSTSLSQISSSLSGAISSTSSLSTAVSTVISGSISTVNSRIDSLSAAGGGGGVAVQDEGVPVTTATTLNFTGAGVSATNAGGGVVQVDIPAGAAASSTSLSQISSSLSSEISSRISGDSSLSTVISSEVSSRASGDTSLSTVISGSTSTVNSRIDSLSTAIGGGGAACPAIRSSNLTKYASAASFSHSLPSGAAAGDFCVIFHSGGFGLATITSPSKAIWDTFQHSATNWAGTTFCRLLTAADISAGSVTVTPSGSFDAVIGGVCFTGAAQLRYPVLELSPRATTIHAPGSGATSSSQDTPYASADDCVLTFLSNRASSTNTSDHGSQLQTTTNANGSGALYANESPSAGGQTANLSYSTAGTGRYEIMLVVRGPN